MRTIVDLPEEQIKVLAEICERQKISRAEAVRRAVAEYASRHATGEAERAFGLWRGRGIDGLAFERRLRREW
jgi:metal-responsive CopG/Arc/MetJ family transcriptional regulator